MIKSIMAIMFVSGLAFTGGTGSAAAQQTTDWGGFYAGGQTSSDSGRQTYRNNGIPYTGYDLDGSTYGAFGGYNVHSGRWVYGAEIAYSTGNVHEANYPIYAFTDFTDVKARVGYTAGKALFYVVAGGSLANWKQNVSLVAATGFNYGLGVDFRISDRFFVGAEYLVRDLDSDIVTSNGPTNDFLATTNSIQIRAGIRF